MAVRVTLDRFLKLHGLSAYRLARELKGRVAQGSVYALSRGTEVKRVDLDTLGGVIGALERLTGEAVGVQDLLEVVPDPVPEMDEESRAWMDSDLARLGEHEPYDWGEDGPPAGRPIRYQPGVGFVVVGGKGGH